MKLFTGMQTLAAGMTFGLALSVAACGSDSDDDGGGSGGSSSGGTTSGKGGTTSGKGGSSSSSGGTSSSSGGTSGSCNPGDPTGSMGDCPAYVECAQTACGAHYAACFGAGSESGNFSGGACETFMECSSECDCSDSTCSQTCFDNAGSACTTCLTNDIASCVVANCFDEAQACAAAPAGPARAGLARAVPARAPRPAATCSAAATA